MAPSLWMCYNPSMRCLITGGAGFIGTVLANYLVGIGHYARVLDDLSAGDPQPSDSRVCCLRVGRCETYQRCGRCCRM